MVTPATQHKLGYGLLALGVIAGLFGAWENDNSIKAVNKQQTQFILQQCQRDNARNGIVIESLEGAQRRAAITFKDEPALAALEIGKIQQQIADFKNSPPCRLP